MFESVKQFFYFLLLVCFSLSCSKSNDNQSLNKTEQLVNKKWKFSAMGGKSPSGMIWDDYAGLPSYQKDDFYLFKPDFTFIYFDNGDLVPGSIRLEKYEGTWSLSNSDSYINITVTVQGIPSTTFAPQKIVEFSTTTMRWECTDISTGNTHWTTYTVIP